MIWQKKISDFSRSHKFVFQFSVSHQKYFRIFKKIVRANIQNVPDFRKSLTRKQYRKKITVIMKILSFCPGFFTVFL